MKKGNRICFTIIIIAAFVLLCSYALASDGAGETASDNTLWSCIKTFAIAMIPIIELRGAIPIALEGYSLSLPAAFLSAYLGNIILIPLIILFTRRVIDWIKSKLPKLKSIMDRFENKLKAKGEKVKKYETFGLLIFVAIPLPGTGAWTGAMIAGLLDIRLKSATPVIATGVLIAGVIVTIVTYGVDWIIGIFA